MLETTRANNYRFGSIGFLAGAALVLAAVAIIRYVPPDSQSQARSDDAAKQTQTNDDTVGQAPQGPVAAGATQSHETGRHPPVLAKHAATVTAEESTFHEGISTAPLSDDNLSFAEQFLATARAETAKYQDVAVARAEGYFQITQDLPLIGAPSTILRTSGASSRGDQRSSCMKRTAPGDGVSSACCTSCQRQMA
jgi:hypothetical protein